MLGAGLGEGELSTSLRVAVDAVLPHDERVRRVAARAGAAGTHVQCLELCCARTQAVLWAAVHCACALFAWV
eukprot:2204865-Prymnesium_polylepis.1